MERQATSRLSRRPVESAQQAAFLARRASKEVRREVDKNCARPISAVEHLFQQEVTARGLPPQRAEIVGTDAEPVFQHARQNSELDPAVAKAKKV